MPSSCRLCQVETARYDMRVCDVCSLAAAAYVLKEPAAAVRGYWDIDSNFDERRNHFLGLAAKRAELGVETYGGLAIGYLAIGFKSDALLAASLGVVGLSGVPNCCLDPAAILFDDRLFRVERSAEISAVLRAQSKAADGSE